MVKLLAAVVVSSSLMLGTPSQDPKDAASQPCPEGEECVESDAPVSEVREIDGKKVRVIYKKSETLNLDGADLVGEIDSPRIRWINGRRHVVFPAQIQERDNFKAELLGALEKI